ncbi:MAG: hypothetical protein EOQ39_28930 [Mesorhizobium sp.]|uniref:hypothetical protein n=1 Tax=Mesorhizobium sp. TaxID=1871066 RepID=UPI000FE635ED|nr:hypothetical protein [Mesorhizobium sp.]RWB06980.1 MAG: hypothetical protein EOQ37_12590 [Mesorhizobium sp.]RWB11010.1 MAG: hypothetical protein EOQ39_28930 [Mesorhizobium sp.]
MNIEVYDILVQSLIATAAVSAAIAVVFYVFTSARQQRDESRLQRAELSLMRENLEARIYDVNRVLMSNEARWKDVNHLLINNDLEYNRNDFGKIRNYRNNSFVVKSGVNFDNLKIDKRSVFVLMPFHHEFDEIYETIREACSQLRITCRRGDEEYKSGNVIPSILEGIINSGVVLCLLDGRNPNVYYELGLTHGLDKPAILLAGTDGGAIPFDIQSRRIIFFKSRDDLSSKIRDAIINTLIE